MSKKPWYKRLFCTHYWVEDLRDNLCLDLSYHKYICVKCGKIIRSKSMPINFDMGR